VNRHLIRCRAGAVGAALLLLLLLSTSAGRLRAAATEPPQVVKAAAAPVIDGVLDDAVWQGAPLASGRFVTYNPAFGATLPQTTEAWLAYDQKFLYAAFFCHDTEPGQIKTSVTRRDGMFNDDWVGFSIDTFNGRQNGYEFFINPSGIQGDLLNTAGQGENSAPDWVWDSAGRITADGYQVEVRIPWKSIRFRSGADVTMGVLFWRRISRLGQSGSWPELTPGAGMLNVHAPVRFEKLDTPLVLEVLPSFTYSRDQVRQTPDEWAPAENSPDFGVGVKYGLTSSITAEATVNPDFSQVESDAFQVEVNQRYPIFYSEKRPFFMENMGIFNLAATNGDFNMSTAVHTRTIVDPLWGVKTTGNQGRVAFGFLAAGDEWPGRELDGEVIPNEGKRAGYMIGRANYTLSGDNYIGGIVTSRTFAGEANRVAGADFQYRLGDRHQFSGFALYSRTRADGASAADGAAAILTYEYSTPSLGICTALEHYDPGFRMDTAFYQRTGINRIIGYFGPVYQPKSDRWAWIKSVNPFLYAFALHDTVTGMDDYLALAALRMNFVRQGSLRLDYIHCQEAWAGRLFHPGIFRVQGSLQATNWFRFGFNFNTGRNTYYDLAAPVLGNSLSVGGNVTVQPDTKLNLTMDVRRNAMDHPDGGNLYTAAVANWRTTYQFNKSWFVRATLRYDSYRQRVLTDFLVSYTYIPGTVMFVGYGSLVQRQDWDDGEWRSGDGSWLTAQRGLFIKLSYLWQK